MRVITNAGPGVKHDIQRALNVRNLDPKTALTQEQVAYLDPAGSYEAEAAPYRALGTWTLWASIRS
jgi:hypothetical protein